jgi:hypothetical protein
VFAKRLEASGESKSILTDPTTPSVFLDFSVGLFEAGYLMDFPILL